MGNCVSAQSTAAGQQKEFTDLKAAIPEQKEAKADQTTLRTPVKAQAKKLVDIENTPEVRLGRRTVYLGRAEVTPLYSSLLTFLSSRL